VLFMSKVDWQKIVLPFVEEAIGIATLLIPEPKVEEVKFLTDVEEAEVNSERLVLIKSLLKEVKESAKCPICLKQVEKTEEDLDLLDKQITSQERVARIREDLKQLLSKVKETGEEFPFLVESSALPAETKKVEGEVVKGTACIPCASDHFSTVAGLISDEAVRMARRSGVQDEEVVRRILRASDQLNAMEREDLSVEKIAQLPPKEKELAVFAQNKAAEIRHELNNLKSVEDLEKVAVDIRNVRDTIGKEYFKSRLEK